MRSLHTIRSCLVALCLTSCASTNLVSVAQPAPRVSSIAMTRFYNLSAEPRAGRIITELLLNELSRLDLRVVDVSGFDERGEVVFDRSRAEEIGRFMGVDAVLTGTVIDYGYAREKGEGANLPSIIFDAMLVSSSDGSILWEARIDGAQTGLFSVDAIPIEELAQRLVAQITEDLDRVSR